MASWVIKTRENFREFVNRKEVRRWYSARLPRNWTSGDTLFIWASQPHLRIIGLGRLVNPDDGFGGGTRHFTIKNETNPIAGPTITELRADRILRTASFLKSGPAGTIFPLTGEQGSRLAQLVARADGPLAVIKGPLGRKIEKKASKLVAAFGDPEQNRLVERAAIAAAKRHYRKLEFAVTSVERLKCGYDLKCRKGRGELHVEVKGCSGLGRGFFLTAGELRTAQTDATFKLCLVRDALNKPTVTNMSAGDMLQNYRFEPLAHRAVWTNRGNAKPHPL